jgi:hypothetical protein
MQCHCIAVMALNFLLLFSNIISLGYVFCISLFSYPCILCTQYMKYSMIDKKKSLLIFPNAHYCYNILLHCSNNYYYRWDFLSQATCTISIVPTWMWMLESCPCRNPCQSPVALTPLRSVNHRYAHYVHTHWWSILSLYGYMRKCAIRYTK